MMSGQMTEMERRLLQVEQELATVQAQNRLWQQKFRRKEVTTRIVCLLAIVVCVVSFGSNAVFPTASASSTAQRPVSVLDAPVLIVDKEKKAIVEISADPGKYGLTVHGPTGESVFLGSSKTKNSGLIQVLGPERKMLALVNGEGFTSYNTSGHAVASLGARAGGSGFMTLGNANGDGIVEAGMTQDSKGIVRDYPLGGPPPMVIPNTIMGGKAK